MASTKSALLCFTLVVRLTWSLEFTTSSKSGYNSLLKINDKDIDRSIGFSVKTIDNLQRLEENILNAQIAAHTKITVSNANDEARETAKNALIIEKTTTHLISRFCYKKQLSHTKCAQIINNYNASNTNEPGLHEECLWLSQACTNEQKQSKYRPYSGMCNHANSPSLGRSLTAYKRLLQPVYGDGVHTIKRSMAKKSPLPSARLVSDKLIRRDSDNMSNADGFTVGFAHWGEFVEHDLAQTVSHKMIHFDNSINCCTSEGSTLAPRYMHPFCSSIQVPNDDTFYKSKDVKCLSYVRSMGGLRDDCSFGPIDQLNQATHYLDASNVYGNDVTTTKLLRNGIRGQMRNAQNYLPKSDHSYMNELHCREDKDCFVAGDSRVNSHPQLTALHTLFLREHNRIAEMLSELNPLWNDANLFQATRRLLIAEIQHITYDEWLPLLLPEREIYKITSQKYQESVDPAVSNSFATAAIRVFKSLIPEYIQLFNEDRTLNASLKLGEHLYKTNVVENIDLGYFLRGLATQNARNLDLTYTKDLIDLYHSELLGLDVISLDIQRGRDHGLPGYNAYRKLCGLKSAKGFEDLFDNIPSETVRTLSQVYHHPDDIDLIIGGLSEKPQSDSSLGDTFTCILSDQFRRTRAGDRFFYAFSNTAKPWEFTPRQLEEIRKVTLSKIICDNSNVYAIQPAAFVPVSVKNNLTKCQSLPGIDLTQWQE